MGSPSPNESGSVVRVVYPPPNADHKGSALHFLLYLTGKEPLSFYFMGTISALLFRARPSSVSLGAIGLLYPKPMIEIRDSLIPFPTK